MVSEQKIVDHIPCDSRLPLWQVEGGSGSDQGEPVNADDFYHNVPMPICPNGQLIPGCFGEYGEVPPEAGDALQGRARAFCPGDPVIEDGDGLASGDGVDHDEEEEPKRRTITVVDRKTGEKTTYVEVSKDNDKAKGSERDHESGGFGSESAGAEGAESSGGDRAGAEGPDAGEPAGGEGAADRAGAED